MRLKNAWTLGDAHALVARPVLGVGANRRFGCGRSTFSDAVGSTLTR